MRKNIPKRRHLALVLKTNTFSFFLCAFPCQRAEEPENITSLFSV